MRRGGCAAPLRGRSNETGWRINCYTRTAQNFRGHGASVMGKLLQELRMVELRIGRLMVAALAMMSAAPAGAAAQELTAYATASVDQSNIQLVGASVRPAGLG